MTEFLGADPDALLALAKQMRRDSQRLDRLGDRLTTRMSAVPWTGTDAEDFRHRLTAAGESVESLSMKLDSGAEALATQAAQQEAASSANGSIDADKYGDLIGGQSLWSVLINGGERLADPFRDEVTTDSLGGSYAKRHPNWDPSGIDLSPEAIASESVQQGNQGDCWFMASYMAVASDDPQLLADHVSGVGEPPGSEGWDVQLSVGDEWKTVHVDPDELGNSGSLRSNDTPGVMSIYERAMINECDGRPSGVSADSPAKGLEMITGQDVQESDTSGQPSFDDYRAAVDDGRPVTVMTDPLKPIGNSDLVAAHVYQVSGYDPETKELILTNPHGPDASTEYHVRVKPDSLGYSSQIFMTGMVK